MKEPEGVSLVPVSMSDHRFLYRLLKERPSCANISHRRMPEYREHVRFVQSRPYESWFVIRRNRVKLGSVYLSKRGEIGVFVRRRFWGRGLGGWAIRQMIEKHPGRTLVANISPKNARSIKLFKRVGFTHVQNTYEFRGG